MTEDQGTPSPVERVEERIRAAHAWAPDVAEGLRIFWTHTIDVLTDERIRIVVAELFAASVPWQFFTAPASSSGKNHPAWQNPVGGLARHVTEMAIGMWRIAQIFPELTDASAEPTPQAMDILLTSVALHDAYKGGVPWEHRTSPEHHALATRAWKEAAGGAWLEPAVIENVATAIWWHAGRWTPGWDGIVDTLPTRTNVYATALHICDMVYSDTNLNLLFQPIPIPRDGVRRR